MTADSKPKPLYTAEDLAEFVPERDLGFPGEFPFTRGIQPTMYRGRLWTMRQYAGMGDAEESNHRYKFLLAQGTAGLSVAFDLPTQIGYDSDSPYALGEVGKVGVAIDSIEDMERLFEGIPLDRISTSMTINATASILLALYVAVARRTGADVKKLSGTVQNDILKEYIARGTYIYPVRHAMRIVTDLFAWAGENVPEWNTISISGYHMREAGSTLTAQQPENNIVRTAIQALAAVLGGTQSLHTNGYDEALALPTEEAARIALRTQQIIACESGVANTIDPVAGSYAIEALTTGIEEEVRGYFARIEALGGMLAAIERGWVQQEIQNAAYATQRAIDSGEATVVGVNRFTRETEPGIPTQRMDEALERKQVERLRALRARRDGARWQASLDRVRDAARDGANLMPAILEAVESCATVGEIATALRETFGEYHESVRL